MPEYFLSPFISYSFLYGILRQFFKLFFSGRCYFLKHVVRNNMLSDCFLTAAVCRRAARQHQDAKNCTTATGLLRIFFAINNPGYFQLHLIFAVDLVVAVENDYIVDKASRICV
ncbi:MAG: hypothetical protein D3904_09820 [Candidatus Electrothrix sp. EH2]|nr:hypothetical protein [Candidatus Electrothrix sp. EH2]